MQKTVLVFLLSILMIKVYSQNQSIWNNKKCAVSLTYDDALNVDLDNAIPALDSVGLKASFYLSGYSGAINRIDEWRAIAKYRHELGNHTLYHPCTGGPGRSFVTADYDLSKYSIRRITDEIRMTNTLLKAIDGKTKRTFAYPCGDTKIGDSSYISSMKNEFVAARGVKPEMSKINQIDLYNVNCYGINGETGDQLIALVKKAMETNTLLVFLFHGVGGGHSLNVTLQAHSQLLHFLKQNEKDIWIAPMIDIAEYVKSHHK
ncbi:MAG TPA: polysaccharide deacetylase family protein [Segetibacter sp.]|nr:polysaccharide deacetylase family protein [Segetibacter sp.]